MHPARCTDTCECAVRRHLYLRRALTPVMCTDACADQLDAIRESEDAFPVLTLVPWRWLLASDGLGSGTLPPSQLHTLRKPRRVLSWETSALGHALGLDAVHAQPCTAFVGHRHSQYALDKYFAGDYPGSSARIPNNAGIFAIMMQSLLFFVPGTIVEVEPVHYPQNVWLLSGSAVKAEYEDGVGSQVNLLGGQLELDQDTVRSAVELEEDDNLRHLAAESDAQRKRRLAEASEFQKWLKESGDDLTGDLLAGRFLFFFTVPKVGNPTRSQCHATTSLPLHPPCLPSRLCSADPRRASPRADDLPSLSLPRHSQVKFTLHFVFFLLYLGLLTYFVMLAYDVGDADTRTAAELRTVYRLELTLWLWSATRAVGETKDFGSEFSGEAVKMYIRGEPHRGPPFPTPHMAVGLRCCIGAAVSCLFASRANARRMVFLSLRTDCHPAASPARLRLLEHDRLHRHVPAARHRRSRLLLARHAQLPQRRRAERRHRGRHRRRRRVWPALGAAAERVHPRGAPREAHRLDAAALGV